MKTDKCEHKFEIQDDDELRYYCVKCGFKGEKVDVDFQPIPDNTKNLSPAGIEDKGQYDDYEDIAEELDKEWLKNKSQEILDRLKKEGNLTIISKEETAEINSNINKEMKKLRNKVMDREYNKIWNGQETATNATEEQYVEAINSEEDVIIHTPLNQQVSEYYVKQIKINIIDGKVIKVDYSNLQESTAYIIEKNAIINYLEEAVEFLKGDNK